MALAIDPSVACRLPQEVFMPQQSLFSTQAAKCRVMNDFLNSKMLALQHYGFDVVSASGRQRDFVFLSQPTDTSLNDGLFLRQYIN